MRTAAPPRPRSARRGFSLLELTAAAVLVGIVAAAAVPRFAGDGRAVRADACDRCREAIDLHAALHRRNTGDWPAADLGDLAADPDAFPNGLPVCPADGSPYVFDRAAGATVPHPH